MTLLTPQALPKLYIAHEDLKDRYDSEETKGRQCLRAYVESVERGRKISIRISYKENGTVEFTFAGEGMRSREGLAEAKVDLQGELCSVSGNGS